MKTQIAGLDAVRFATSVLVMMFHLCFWRNGQLDLQPGWLDAGWWFGWVGVEIFFTISGFVIALSARHASPAQYAMSRTVRLVPMIWICATMTFVGTLWLTTGPHPNLVNNYIFTILLRPVGSHIDIVYWTLTVEIAFYLFVFAAIRLASFERMLQVLLIIGLVSSVFDGSLLAIRIHGGAHGHLAGLLVGFSNKHMSRLLLLRHGCFFALGSLLWSRMNAGTFRRHFLIGALLLLGATSEVVYGAMEEAARFPAGHFSIYDPTIAWLIGVFLIFLVSLRRVDSVLHVGSLPRLLRTLGLMTFPLYLLHNNLGVLIRERFFAQTHANWIATGGAIVVLMAVSYVVATKLDPRAGRLLRALLQRATRGKEPPSNMQAIQVSQFKHS
jgi:peptidoglycan/LPS O-acetylase OafA/YrhL